MISHEGYYRCDYCGKVDNSQYNTATGNHSICERLHQFEQAFLELKQICESPAYRKQMTTLSMCAFLDDIRNKIIMPVMAEQEQEA